MVDPDSVRQSILNYKLLILVTLESEIGFSRFILEVLAYTIK
jgi:hypothetical protein